MKEHTKSILIKIVIVEPIGELNLGNIARLCANFEVDELRLVAPRCNLISKESQRMALRGIKYLKNAGIYSNLLDAIQDCSRVVATCGRIDHGEIPLHSSKNALQWLLETESSKPIAIVFGREDRGLTNSELQMAQKVISLKTSEKYPSLNLSHAVAIILHQLNHFRETSNSEERTRKCDPASAKELNDFLEDAKNLLLEIGFLYPHTERARMEKIKGLLQRGETRSEEVSLIRGIVRQVRWFSNKNNQQINRRD